MEDFTVIQGHVDSAWKIMSVCELAHDDGTKVRITTMGCPTQKLGTLVQTITSITNKEGVIESSTNLYHIPVSRLHPQKGEDGNICGYTLISETEPKS